MPFRYLIERCDWITWPCNLYCTVQALVSSQGISSCLTSPVQGMTSLIEELWNCWWNVGVFIECHVYVVLCCVVSVCTRTYDLAHVPKFVCFYGNCSPMWRERSHCFPPTPQALHEWAGIQPQGIGGNWSTPAIVPANTQNYRTTICVRSHDNRFTGWWHSLVCMWFYSLIDDH